MVFLSLLAAFGLVALASAAAAPEATDSPPNVMHLATFNTSISGTVMFSSTNGSVLVDVNLANLPQTGGPFMYHIHERPVPNNGTCGDALGHFNPYNGTANARTTAEMEVGDLSGKHGPINGTSLHVTYFEPYLSLNPENSAFPGGLSVVVHYANSTRFACANIAIDASMQSFNNVARFARVRRAPPSVTPLRF